jgi:small-conductance mechanosensitive channel
MNLSSFEFGRRALIGTLGLVLIALLLAGFFTRGGDPTLEYNAPPSLPNASGLVDQSPLETARNLAGQAATPQEQQFAQQALHSADHEVDQAFASALRDATENAPPLTGWALTYSQRIDKLNQRIKTEQQNIAALNATQDKASSPDAVTQQIAMAQAQLDLDLDELADLQQDLVRVDGDRRAKIQQALDEHEASQKQASQTPSNAAVVALESPDGLRNLPGKIRALASLRARHKELVQARADTFALAEKLTRQHDSMEKDSEAQQSASPSGEQPGNGTPVAATGPSQSAALAKLHQLTEQRKILTELNSRIHDLQLAAQAYENWDKTILLQQRTIIHRILRVFAVLTIILLLVLLLGALIRKSFRRQTADQRRLRHLRLIAELSVQVGGWLLILLVIFGPPRQMGVYLGLATAGLTVVLKDFIVAFFGWFVLMGKNGIRVGDWVEINGVGGEVVELSLFRTALLETGDFADVGHPTGRRITFLNSYAIEGRYFNFSTAGQWLWDELIVTVPPGADSYSKVDEIRAAVAKATEADAKIAAQEWQKATRGYPVQDISPDAAVDLRPVPEGISVRVRYITRAPGRYEMRARLYHDVIEILHFGAKPGSPSALAEPDVKIQAAGAPSNAPEPNASPSTGMPTEKGRS